MLFSLTNKTNCSRGSALSQVCCLNRLKVITKPAKFEHLLQEWSKCSAFTSFGNLAAAFWYQGFRLASNEIFMHCISVYFNSLHTASYGFFHHCLFCFEHFPSEIAIWWWSDFIWRFLSLKRTMLISDICVLQTHYGKQKARHSGLFYFRYFPYDWNSAQPGSRTAWLA